MPKDPARPGEQARWLRAYETWWWLDRYRMGPSAVGELWLDEVDLIPQIAEMADEVRAEAQEKAARG